MKVFETAKLPDLSYDDQLHVYNGLDCCITLEILPKIKSKLSDQMRSVYAFELDLQAPALDMMLRGIKVDQVRRQEWIAELERQIAFCEDLLNQYARCIWGKNLNARSPTQLCSFFYDTLRLPEQVKKDRTSGKYRRTADREALEKLSDYFIAKPFVRVIEKIRECGKKLSVLRSGISRNGRLHSSYNVAATETGRWSSSFSAAGGGTNMQNITEELRVVFVADPGMKMAYIDLEQAESRAVAALAWACTGKDNYWRACESGDLHTTTAKLIWPQVVVDRETADAPFYRHFSYRDMAKRGGHGTNYYGTPFTMAKHLHVEVSLMQEFQRAYFAAFPEIREWHMWVARQLQTKGYLVTPFGRVRYFMGRRGDDSTLREAIANSPQSTVADALNKGMLQLFSSPLPIQLLAQVHDAVLIQYPEDLENEIIPQALDLIKIRIPIEGVHKSNLGEVRYLEIPSEAAVGWNWAKQKTDTLGNVVGNVDGLRKWKGRDERGRSEIIDRPLSRLLGGYAFPTNPA